MMHPDRPHGSARRAPALAALLGCVAVATTIGACGDSGSGSPPPGDTGSSGSSGAGATSGSSGTGSVSTGTGSGRGSSGTSGSPGSGTGSHASSSSGSSSGGADGGGTDGAAHDAASPMDAALADTSTGSVDGSGTSGGDSGVVASSGCGKTPTLKNSPSSPNQNTLTVSGASRQFLIRWPSTYDNSHPYRLILDFHGAGGSDTDLGPSYFGLFPLSNNSTIFIAPSASGGFWNVTNDLAFVDEILTTVEADLCIDKSRVELEGFSQGGAMVWNLACQRPGVFRAVVGHSGGGLANPTSCQPIPYLGSLGLSDISGNSQKTQTDPFAQWNGCTVATLPTAPTGGHICTPYAGCPASDPVIWCSYDGGHTPSPTDSGQSSSWMPQEVWGFFSKF